MTGADCNNHNNQTASLSLRDRKGRSIKQELLVLSDSSENSDHTEKLQTNLMQQVHEDLINRPNMLVCENQDSSNSKLIQEICELVKVT